MKKKIVLLAIIALLIAFVGAYVLRLRTDNRILSANVESLHKGIQKYRTDDSLSAASVMRLQVEKGELEEYSSQLAKACDDLNIKLRRVKSAAQTTTETQLTVYVPIHDTIIVNEDAEDTFRCFSWRDSWSSVEGMLNRDSVKCSISNVDTLVQVVHRVPRKFLFIKFGTKAVRQEIFSKNPHSKIVFSEYLEIR